MSQNIYDNPDFFQGYSQFRRSQQGLAGAPEWETLRNMLPPLQGLCVLDLGCGFGAFSRWAREAGAQRVIGVDLSEKMLERARALTHDPHIAYYRANIEHPGLADASFDVIYSALVFHYLPDLHAMCVTLRKLLNPGGSLVFSVEHPIYTAPTNPGWQTNADGRQAWQLDAYLLEGQRVTDWIAPGIIKYHRTVASYVNSLLAQGFCLTHLQEWGPTPAQIVENPEWAVELQRPPFLLMAART